MIPMVSVVVPTYNRSEKVRGAVSSILAQSLKDLEVIVVDDGSSDRTQQLLAENFGNRIRYFWQPNQGASVARNKGIEEARGEWIAFLDSDDRWEPDKLEWQLKAIDQFGSQCGACYTDVRFFNFPETRTMFELAESNYRHDREIGINNDVLRLLVKPGGAGMVICLSSFIARTEIMRKMGRFNPALLYSQDSEFMFRMAMITRFCYVNRPLVLFDRSPVADRHIGVSSEWNKMEFFLRDSQLRLEELMRSTTDQPAAIRSLVRRQLGAIHNGWVNCYLESNQLSEARLAASKAVWMNPTMNVAIKLLLTWLSPSLALRIVRGREKNKVQAFTV